MERGIERDPGSFRDPESWILNDGDRLVRRIPVDLVGLLAQPEFSKFLAAEITQGRLVPGRTLPDQDMAALGLGGPSGMESYLEHPRLPFVGYPHEWSATMLAEAGRLTLDLQCDLLPLGVELKDATAFNVLFQRGRPVFVDWGSFRTAVRQDVWYALGQFQRMFLHPLLLRTVRGWTPSQCFLTHLDGIPLTTVTKELGRARILSSPTLWLDVLLPSWFESRSRGRTPEIPDRPAVPLPAASAGPGFQISNLRRIRRLVDRLERRFVHDGEWEDYAVACHYHPAADEAKRTLVLQFLGIASAASVTDLGCNSGNYSYLAASTGAKVIAADGDEGAIARLHARLKREPAEINPVVLNLANPSPALGWCNRERTSFMHRGKSGCVMALALIHHFRVSCNWPIDHIVDFLDELSEGWILAEFVPRDDPMFKTITRMRDEDYSDWTIEAWEASLGRRFVRVKEAKLPASPRTLALWRRR